MTDGLNIGLRRATIQDYEAMLRLHFGTYEDLDYMPSMFHYFLHSHNYVVAVGEANGELLALTTVRFQPGGNLVAGFSGRRSSKLTGSIGLRTAGESPWKAAGLMEYPKLEYMLGASRTFPKLSDGTHTIYYQWLAQLYKTSVTELKSSIITYQPTNSLLDISYSDVEDILRSTNKIETCLKKYAKDDVICQWHWRPMKIDDQTDMKELFATSSKTFITVSRASGRKLEATNCPDVANLLREPDNIISSLSYSVSFPVKFGLRHDITFYGLSPESLADHVHAHVSHVTRVYTGSVAIVVQFPKLEVISPADVETRLHPMMGKSRNGDGDLFALWSRKFIAPSKM